MKTLILLLLLSLIALQACEITNMTTVEQVEDVRECLSKRVEFIDEHLKEFYTYSDSVIKLYKKLNEEGKLCKELKTTLTYNQMPKHCRISFTKRVQRFNQVSYQHIRLSKKIKRINEQKIAIKLKIDLLESAYDLIIKRAKANLKLIDSIEDL